jgi:hypothetical protein
MKLFRVVTHGVAREVLSRSMLLDGLKANDGELEDSFTLSLPLKTERVEVNYELAAVPELGPDASAAPLVYRKFVPPPSVLIRGVDAVISFGQGFIDKAKTTLSEQVVRPAVVGATTSFLDGASNPLIKTPPRQASALLLGSPGFIGINRTWEFSPVIPANGTFSGDLVLQYDESDFPDDPNFDETKLRIVSYDPVKRDTVVLPTTLDRTAKTATTRLDRLAASYTLAVPGPFERTTLITPVSGEQTLALVNTGTSESTASIEQTGAEQVEGEWWACQVRDDQRVR